MSQFNTSGVKTFKADAAITRHMRVKLTATGVDVAGANEWAVGFAEANAALGENVAVRLLASQGTFKAIAVGAITKLDVLYGGASGRVTKTDGGTYTARFIALEAASGAGSILEVLPTSLS
jgi:hypothetical protein